MTRPAIGLASGPAAHAGGGPATPAGWGLFALLFLASDLSVAAYVAGPRIEAAAYDALHSYVGPVGLALLARLDGHAALLPVAYVRAAHIGSDRLLGYGVKYPSAFGDTHLGRTGRAPRW